MRLAAPSPPSSPRAHNFVQQRSSDDDTLSMDIEWSGNVLDLCVTVAATASPSATADRE